MPQVLKEGQDRLAYLEKVKAILTQFAQTTGGIESALLMDDQHEVVESSSDSSNKLLASIGTATAGNIVALEDELKSVGVIKEVQEMELVIEDRRVFALKVSTKPNYALCVICPIDGGAKAGTIKAKFHNSVKNEIIKTMKEEGLIKKE